MQETSKNASLRPEIASHFPVPGVIRRFLTRRSLLIQDESPLQPLYLSKKKNYFLTRLFFFFLFFSLRFREICRVLVRAVSYTIHGLIPASCVFADRYNREEVVASLGREINLNPPLTLGQLPDTSEELLKLDQVSQQSGWTNNLCLSVCLSVCL
jgi:hypothetical protein